MWDLLIASGEATLALKRASDLALIATGSTMAASSMYLLYEAASAGAQTIPLIGPTPFPRETGDPTFTWLSANETIPDSESATGQLLLSPKAMKGLVKIPNELARYALGVAEVLVRRALVERAARTLDLALLEGSASLTVRCDLGGYPSRRYLDVTACSLRPTSTLFVPPARRGYLPDVAPPMSYLCEVDPAPRHSAAVSCLKPCLAALNASEAGATEPVRCTSGVSDGLELARRTQSPAITRLLWFYGA